MVTSRITRGIGSQRWRPLFLQGFVGIFCTLVQDCGWGEHDVASIVIPCNLIEINTSIHLHYCLRKLHSYSVWLHETKCFCLLTTAANSLNCVGGKHSFAMLAFCRSIFVKVCCCFRWNTSILTSSLSWRGEAFVLFWSLLGWLWDRALDPKNCFEFKSSGFACPFLPPPPHLSRLTLIRCINKFASHHVHQEIGMRIVYATQDHKCDAVFEWFYIILQ